MLRVSWVAESSWSSERWVWQFEYSLAGPSCHCIRYQITYSILSHININHHPRSAFSFFSFSSRLSASPCAGLLQWNLYRKKTFPVQHSLAQDRLVNSRWEKWYNWFEKWEERRMTQLMATNFSSFVFILWNVFYMQSMICQYGATSLFWDMLVITGFGRTCHSMTGKWHRITELTQKWSEATLLATCCCTTTTYSF